jgi:hypothetical protein
MQTDKQILYSLTSDLKKHEQLMISKGIEANPRVLCDSSDDE